MNAVGETLPFTKRNEPKRFSTSYDEHQPRRLSQLDWLTYNVITLIQQTGVVQLVSVTRLLITELISNKTNLFNITSHPLT